MNVATILERAADLIEPPGAWTQNAACRDEWGVDIEGIDTPEDSVAVCFCASEAIYRVSGTFFTQCPAHQFLTGLVGHIPEWNDEPGRTQEEVVAKLREAAKLAAARSAGAA